MAKFFLLVAIASISSFAFAASGPLDGRSYCRTVTSKGGFGRPPGQFQHCISFAEGVATDSAHSAFGNPSEHSPYSFANGEVIFKNSQYGLSRDGLTLTTVLGSTTQGTVFTLTTEK